VRNRFWAPPPAKADIATAILTNVIEHLVLLLPPNKHAFTAKAVWADYRHKKFPVSTTPVAEDGHANTCPSRAVSKACWKNHPT